MARDTLFSNPYFGRLISSVNAFPVRRGTGDIGAVKETLRRLKDGKPVLVFPEGTRTRDGRIGPINANSLLIAKKAGAAIVPMVIDGAFEAWPRTQLLPSPQSIYVTYCEHVSITEGAEWPIERIGQVVEERMHEAMVRSRQLRARAARSERRP
jgi:1-acyl-sn-glycerol-3-phosphate acyltransferase